MRCAVEMEFIKMLNSSGPKMDISLGNTRGDCNWTGGHTIQDDLP